MTKKGKNVQYTTISLARLYSLAVTGDVKAQYELGRRYTDEVFKHPTGIRYLENRVKGAIWFLKAAKAGHVKAMEILAKIYVNHFQDVAYQKQAVKWMERLIEIERNDARRNWAKYHQKELASWYAEGKINVANAIEKL